MGSKGGFVPVAENSATFMRRFSKNPGLSLAYKFRWMTTQVVLNPVQSNWSAQAAMF
jgi:hypothetical protein